jgi:hypothetical protein
MDTIKYRSGIVRLIAEATDHETAMRLVSAYSGRRLCIPAMPVSGSKLELVIGSAAAGKLSKILGRERLYIPHEKGNMIIWLNDQGKSVAEISHRLGISRRRVQQILNGHESDHPNPLRDGNCPNG